MTPAVIRRAHVIAIDEHRRQMLQHRDSVYRASLPASAHDARLSRFEPRDDADRRNIESAREWVSQCIAGKAPNLSLYGPPGTGKTWLLAAMGWALVPTAISAAYVRAPAAWAAIRASFDRQTNPGDSEASLMGRWTTVQVLLLDELGAGHITEAYRACIAEIIGRRTDDGLPTAVASNLPPNRWADATDDRAADRMAGGLGIPVLGSSRRRT